MATVIELPVEHIKGPVVQTGVQVVVTYGVLKSVQEAAAQWYSTRKFDDCFWYRLFF